ncbi:terminase small subunit [Falsochrobactrum sp. TDYN1]|uniref:Terminase small subunit n=1 Tax=Falsochrobactrum tianjinense TaxID=2706015 RepID=A0A949PST3_9HYPH|nr:terminase small subunit [Falsochrobactrum sp. TDYN1]
MSLTPKQEAFALAFFETGNAAEAYRRSYDVSENAKDQWIYVEACQLLDNPKVAIRLQELRDHAERHSIYTRQQALDEYEKARDLAIRAGNPSAAVSAINGKVKLYGLEAPVKAKVDHTSSDGSMTPKPTTIRILAADDGSDDKAPA